MKKLISTLVLTSLPFSSHAVVQEIVEVDTGKQIVSMVKDLQVKDMLEQTSEFKKCRNLNSYKSGDNNRDQNIKAATDCFKKELTNQSNPKKLEQLSENLNLQHYGLVQSKNVKDIQKYLTDKMIETLTGVNPNDQTANFKESLKFGKKKLVDQKLFIEMYKTQLGKNALYEISRFCFENLRSTIGKADKTTFADYWVSYEQGSLNVDNIDDKGEPRFGQIQDPEDKEKIFKDIFSSIQGSDGKPMPDENMSAFFMECGQLIVPLCKKFQDKLDLTETTSQVDAGTSEVSVGAAACLTKGRIQDYRKAISNAQVVADQFQKMADEDRKSLLVGLDKGTLPAKFFGQDDKDPTIDDLTNNTSADIVTGGYIKDQNANLKAQECEEKPELANCEGFIAEGDDLDKAKHNVEMEMTLKREVEMARVRELKRKNDSTLEEYLTENGFLDLLETYKTMDEAALVKAIGESYEAKKIATLEAINGKLGKRQLKESKKIDKDQVSEVIQESKEERARLAQVVLFNNIITSNLSLKKRDSSGTLQDAGRNVNAWLKEEEALKNVSVDPELFANLKTSSEGVTGLGKDSQIAGFEILDEILKPKETSN